jgi:hypothetical protein
MSSLPKKPSMPLPERTLLAWQFTGLAASESHTAAIAFGCPCRKSYNDEQLVSFGYYLMAFFVLISVHGVLASDVGLDIIGYGVSRPFGVVSPVAFELILSVALYSLLRPAGPASYGRPHVLEAFVPVSGFVLLCLVYSAASNRLAAFDEDISRRLFAVSLLSASAFVMLLGCVCILGFYRQNVLFRFISRLLYFIGDCVLRDDLYCIFIAPFAHLSRISTKTTLETDDENRATDMDLMGHGVHSHLCCNCLSSGLVRYPHRKLWHRVLSDQQLDYLDWAMASRHSVRGGSEKGPNLASWCCSLVMVAPNFVVPFWPIAKWTCA